MSVYRLIMRSGSIYTIEIAYEGGFVARLLGRKLRKKVVLMQIKDGTKDAFEKPLPLALLSVKLNDDQRMASEELEEEHLTKIESFMYQTGINKIKTSSTVSKIERI